MSRYIVPLLLLMPAVLAAEEVAEKTAESGGGAAGWATGIGAIIAAVVGWLMAKFGGKKEVDTTPIDPKASLSDAKNKFIDGRLIPFAVNTGEHWLLTQVPALAMDAMDGDGFQWKNHWTDLKKYVKERVLKKFAAENLDVIDYIGSSEELDDIVDRQLMKLITKLPDSVTRFIPDALVDKLTDKAKEFLVEKGKDLLSK